MNSQASKTVEEETRMMDLSQDGTGPASSTSVPDDSILDKSDDDIEELEQTSSIMEGAKKNSESVSALAHNFTKVRVGSENVFLSAGQSNSTSLKNTSSVRAPEPPKQEGGGLPREYLMVRAARRNWLAATALGGIGPLGRKAVCQASGFTTGSMIGGGWEASSHSKFPQLKG